MRGGRTEEWRNTRQQGIPVRERQLLAYRGEALHWTHRCNAGRTVATPRIGGAYVHAAGDPRRPAGQHGRCREPLGGRRDPGTRQPDRPNWAIGDATSRGRSGDRRAQLDRDPWTGQHPPPLLPDPYPLHSGRTGCRAIRLADRPLPELGQPDARGAAIRHGDDDRGADALRLHYCQRSHLHLAERGAGRRPGAGGRRPRLPLPRPTRLDVRWPIARVACPRSCGGG